MSSDSRHMPNAMTNKPANRKSAPHRKVSLEHGRPRTSNGAVQQGAHPSMANMNMTQRMHMNEMMMMDYGMMGMDPDHYGMGPQFMPMHPAEAAAMGPVMDQMMDFPPQRFMPPMQRRLNRHPQRNAMHQDFHCPSESFDPEHSQTAQTSLFPRTMLHHGTLHESASSTDAPAVKRKNRAPSTTSFPTKLYKILADPNYVGYIAWLPHGRAWRVLKPKALEEDVIPKFFRSDRYASFMRQVNGWGFKRITEGPDLNAYYHEMFLRGLPQVCAKMRRPAKGDAGASKDLGQHPDFYKISMFAPLPGEGGGQPTNNIFPDLPTTTPPHPPKSGFGLAKSPGVVSRDDRDRKIPADDQSNGKIRVTEGGADESTGEDLDEKALVDDSISTIDEIGVDQFTTSAPPESPPRIPAIERSLSDAFGNRTPHDYADGQATYGGGIPSSSGASISSWNDHQDQDLMWGGMSATSSVGSPTGTHWSTSESFTNTNFFGQVTPPGRMRPMPNAGGLIQRPNERMQVPYEHSTPFSSGLSVADLCYLTQQNRILLSQAHGRSSDIPK